MPIRQTKRLAAALDRARTRKKRIQKPPIQTTLPGLQQPVSAADIELWIETLAPHISPLRRADYARQYNVAEKIAAAKDRGQWPPESRSFL